MMKRVCTGNTVESCGGANVGQGRARKDEATEMWQRNDRVVDYGWLLRTRLRKITKYNVVRSSVSEVAVSCPKTKKNR